MASQESSVRSPDTDYVQNLHKIKFILELMYGGPDKAPNLLEFKCDHGRILMRVELDDGMIEIHSLECSTLGYAKLPDPSSFDVVVMDD